MKEIIGRLGGVLIGIGSALFMAYVASWMAVELRGGVASLTLETATALLLGMISGLGMAALGYMWFRMSDSGA